MDSPSASHTHANFENWVVMRWTEQLYRELDNLLYQHSLSLPTPLIKIAPMISTWGQWDPITRTITLSERLIQEHSWDIVIEVLKHEMAHMWVTLHYGDQGKPHGEYFQNACRRLGVAAWAAQAKGELPSDIPRWKDRALPEEEEKLLRRVEKLLALASSSNEHEAYAAMQKVRELYARYNLDQFAAKKASEHVHLILTRGLKRTSQAESMIYSILNSYFFVSVITGKTYDASRLESVAMAEVLGRPENVLMAEYVYHFLWNSSAALWESYKAMHQCHGRARESYVLGVLSGFRNKLAAEKPVQHSGPRGTPELSSAKALIKLAADDVEAYLHQRHPRLSSRSWSNTYRDASAFQAGQREGARLTLNKPITKKGSGVGGYLE